MKRGKFTKLTVIVFTVFFAASAHALTLEFLKNSVVSKFSAEDVELSKKSIHEALEGSEMKVEKSWKNEKTTSSGEAMALHEFQYSGMPCRSLKIVQRHDGQANSSKHSFCMTKEGEWKLLR